MVNFKKIKMGNIILLLVWDSTNEQGKEYKKRRGLKTVKERRKKRIPNLFLIIERSRNFSSTMLFEEFL